MPLTPAALAVLLAALPLAACAAKAPPLPPSRTFEGKDLRSTVVLAHEAEPIPEGKGAIWCAASRLAWDAFPRKAPGAPTAFGLPSDPNVVALLDGAPFPAAALDPASFVAIGGFDDRGVLEEIRKATAEKFGVATDLGPLPAGPWVAVGYAKLRKDLPFARPFERSEHPFRFRGGTRDLASFRIPREGPEEAKEEVRRQVTVLFSRWTPERVFEGACSIPSKDGGDRLVLALVPRKGTLRETWEAVRAEAAAGKPEPLPHAAEFLVPMANFELTHRFTGLEGGSSDVGREASARLAIFREDLRFLLCESGVKLEAEARMLAPGAEMAASPPRFVFDRPFLLALHREGADAPYFLFWVGTDELLAEDA
jgi:hypothetical protein